MRINTRARYALRLMIDMALYSSIDNPLNLKEISERQKISRRYLAQIIVSLRNNSLVKGMPGKSGGYILARRPEDITVRLIFDAVLGPVNVVDCVSRPENCIKSDFCECRPLYEMINARVNESLDTYTLADLALASEVSRMREPTPALNNSFGADLCSSSG